MIVDWPLVGRDELLARCGDLVGSPGTHAIVLAGDAGMGKTRVLSESARRAAEAGFAVFRATSHHSSSNIPFGALAPLLPAGQDLIASGVPLLRQAGDALTDSAHGKPILLVLDDAHLLDDASSVLVYQLVAARRLFAMASIARDQPCPDAVAGLWRDGCGERLELLPLGRDAVGEALAAALAGVVAAATIDTLARSSDGNPLVLRELVRGSLDAGTLAERHGLWQLRGALAPSAQLAELVDRRLAVLDDAQRLSLELIAIGEPLGLDEAVALGASEVEWLESEGLVTATVAGRRVVIEVAQSSIGDVLRLAVPKLRGMALRRSIAQRIAAVGARRRGDALKLSLLALDGGDVAPREVLAAAAHEAYAAHDFAVALRLARAAEDIERRADTSRLVDAAMYRMGASSHPIAPPVDGTMAELALRAMNHAAVLFWHLGDDRAADEFLEQQVAELAPSAWRDELAAMRATLDVNAGRPHLALQRVEQLDATSGRPFVVSALARMLALPHIGRAADALDWSAPARAEFARLTDRVELFQVNLLTSTESTALHELGRLLEATEVALDGYRVSTEAHDTAGQAFNALVLGRVLATRGLATSALRWFRESMVLFDSVGHRGPARWAVGGVALAAVMRGDHATAVHAIERLDSGASHAATMLDADIARARAWLAVAVADPTAARVVLDQARHICRESGLGALEVAISHDIVRLGGAKDVADRMTELTREVQGDWLPALAADARAVAGRRPDDLTASADELARMGANLLAAETATDAAAALAAAGRQRDAAAWRRRAAMLLGQCEGARTPRLAQAEGPVPLTDREREIALLAASGLSSRVISERLHLSVRTVDNNLARVYGKLGIADRNEIAPALGLA
jgi:DNA-binding CsgD family transcriptional regulator